MILNKPITTTTLAGDSNVVMKVYTEVTSGSAGDTGVIIAAEFDAINNAGTATRTIAIKAIGDIALDSGKIIFPDGTTMNSATNLGDTVFVNTVKSNKLIGDTAFINTVKSNKLIGDTIFINTVKAIKLLGSITYTGTQGANGTWDTSATAPTGTTRLNWNGYLYATRVYNAVYNDLAEFMDKDKNDNASPGDVLVQTENGLVKSFKIADKAVVGVYSDSYGYALGASDIENKYPVGLCGVLFVKVREELEIGNLLVSGENGFAIKSNGTEPRGTIIGKVIENKRDASPSRIKMLILM